MKKDTRRPPALYDDVMLGSLIDVAGPGSRTPAAPVFKGDEQDVSERHISPMKKKMKTAK